MGDTITTLPKDVADLRLLVKRMEEDFAESQETLPRNSQKDVASIYECIERILRTELIWRLEDAEMDADGVHLADRNIRHELRNKMSVIMGFADLLVQTRKIEGECATYMINVREGATEFSEML